MKSQSAKCSAALATRSFDFEPAAGCLIIHRTTWHTIGGNEMFDLLFISSTHSVGFTCVAEYTCKASCNHAGTLCAVLGSLHAASKGAYDAVSISNQSISSSCGKRLSILEVT